MPHLVLLCNIERAPVLDRAATTTAPAQWAFSLNVGTAWSDASTPSSAELVRPWSWSAISRIHYSLRDSKDVEVGVANVGVIDGNDRVPANDLQPLIARLETIQTTARLDWVRGAATEIDASRPAWHAIVGQMSVLPTPTPQSLNLSFLFRVPAHASGVKLFAAPVVTLPAESTAREPATLAQDANDQRIWQWTYAGASPEIRAYSTPCPVAVATDPFIDLSSMWIQSPAGPAFDDDWMEAVEPRLASALTLPLVVTDFLRERIKDALLDDDRVRRACVDLALAAARDVAGLGLGAGPDGVRLAARLFGFAGIQLTKPQWDALETGAPALFPTLDRWREFLRAQTADHSLPILQTPWTEQPAVDVLRQLEDLLGVIVQGRREEASWTLFKAQWEALLNDPQVKSAIAEDLRTRMIAAIDAARTARRVDLRQHLALENLGRFWRDFLHANEDRTDATGRRLLQHCAPAYVRFYARVRWRLGAPGTSEDQCRLPPPPDFHPAIDASSLPPALIAALTPHVAKYALAIGAELAPSTQVRAHAAPHGVTWQVARLQSLTDEDESTDFRDVMRRISGIGILMRRKGTTAWRCLNMAHLAADGRQILDATPLLVPYRLPYRAGLRQVTISYNNQSLIADSPLLQSGMTNVLLHGADAVDRPSLVSYRYSVHPSAVMPGLFYGAEYECAAFAIGNSGVLPASLQQSDTLPRRINLARAAPSSIVTARYQRDVPVGDIRLTDVAAERDRTNAHLARAAGFPAIPSSVVPRTRDLPVLEEVKNAPLILLAPATWKWPGNPRPNIVDFQAALPQVAWECWDRWQGGAGVSEGVRAEVLADYYRTKATSPKASVTLDDPALAPKLHFALEHEVDGAFVAIPGAKLMVTVPSSTVSADSVGKFQSPGVRVRTELHDTRPEGVASTPTGVEVTLRRGKIYRLRICACLNPIPLQSTIPRFATGIVRGAGTEEGFELVAPTDILIEAATATLPDELALWKACTSAATYTPAGERWNVSLTAVGTDAAFAAVQRVEIWRQVWRWQGRPAGPHPDLERDWTSGQGSDYDAAVRRWEATEFGDRLESERSTQEMKLWAAIVERPELKPAAARGIRFFRYDEALASPNGARDDRGLHFRFAIEAFSRYAAIMPPGERSRRAHEEIPRSLAASASARASLAVPRATVLQAQNQSVRNHWRRQFVPCRQQTVPQPRVRLILPLTEPKQLLRPGATDVLDDVSSRTPGLLVVLHDVWHEYGGIGEELEAEVVLAQDPASPANARNFFYEAGPDPIRQASPALRLGPRMGPASTVTLPRTTIVGAVGHYFDRFNSSARFVHSSFILPAPVLPADKPKDLGWWFAKIQFRRLIRTRRAGALSAPTRYAPDASWKRVDLRSDPTPAYWVQYLPPFSMFERSQSPISLSDLRIVRHQDGTRFTLIDLDGRPVTLSPTSSDHEVFELRAVLTRMIADITGRNDQEQYLGVLKQAGAEWTSEAAVNLSDDAKYRVRVIEIQRPKWQPSSGTNVCTPAQNIWDELFGRPSIPGDAQCDARARIVRISEPVDSWIGAACLETV